MEFLQTGQTLGHYVLLDMLGEGGMGRVYRAEDTKLGRFVAVKLLPEEASRNARARQRLLQEARSASVLNHPNIVTIHSIEEHEGVDFIVMEYVEGETLRAVIGRGPLALAHLLDLGSQVAGALAAAHSSGIVHRDIKSENILLGPRGQVKVLDFGLAKPIEGAGGEVDAEAATRLNLTGAGTVLGTVHYMSPEQTRAEQLDARSDIFSLGCVLYEAATGKLPFRGTTMLSVMHAITSSEPRPPSGLRADLPVEFDLIVERALAKDKERRYASASELADALKLLGSTSAAGLNCPAEQPNSTAADDAGGEAVVGRAPEMEKLDELLRRAIEGSGRVAFVTGEPGIGKSALVGEFLRRARRQCTALVISSGRCVEQYGTGEAYLPFLEAVGSLLTGPHRERIVALLRAYAPTWCLQFPAAFVSTVALEKLQQETAGAGRERMLREMGDMLTALAAHSPVALVLEDIHWADPSSVDLLRHLSQRVGDQRLLIIGTHRPGDVEASDHPLRSYKLEMEAHSLCDEIALGSLSQPAVAHYLDSRFAPNDFPRELAALIHAKTEGHPLFVTSLAQFLIERGDITRRGDGWSLTRPPGEMSLEAPENVRSMIRKKLESLGGEDLRALQYASVVGEEFLSTVLAGLLGADDVELEERLAQVERAYRLIETVGEEELPDGSLSTRYRFAHALYRNVLYGDLVGKRRRLLHYQVGERLERHYGPQSARIAAQLASHFERGHDHRRAGEYFSRAGDNAAGLYANAEAAENYGRAIELAKKLPPEEGTEPLISLFRKRGRALMALGRFGEAVDDFTEMLGEARRAGSPEQESAALNALSMTLFYSHRLDEITERADEILRAAERAESDALRIEAMQVLALKHLGSGELAEAERMLDEIIQSARRLGHKSVLLTGLAWRGIMHFFQTEYDEAVRMLLEARALAEELHDSFLLLEGYFVLGMVRGNQGHMSEAFATFEAGLELAERYGDKFWSTRIPNCIGWIYRELQDFESAIAYDQKGVEVGRSRGVLEAQANSLINLGIDHGRAGRGEKTASAFREVEQIFRRDAWFRWRYQIRLQAAAAEHQLALGDLASAEEHAQRLQETATRYRARKYVAVSHKLLAEVALARGDLEATAEELDAALGVLRTHPVPIVAWKTYADLGRLRALRGDEAGALEAFSRAAAIVDGIAAAVREERLRDVFLNSAPVREVFAGAGRATVADALRQPEISCPRPAQSIPYQSTLGGFARIVAPVRKV
ncbi:MAG TPA: protein kinase [Pyrinomonadaceae bacterium]|nr:protein kinase [Pyrinomonadaceae bacterium]